MFQTLKKAALKQMLRTTALEQGTQKPKALVDPQTHLILDLVDP